MPPLFLLRNWVLHFDNLHHIYNQSYKVSRTKNFKLPMIQAKSQEMGTYLPSMLRLPHDSLKILHSPVKSFSQPWHSPFEEQNMSLEL